MSSSIELRHFFVYVIVYFLCYLIFSIRYYVDYIVDAEQTNQPVTLYDTEQTKNDVSPATNNKSVARIHITLLFYILYMILFMLILSISIGDAEQTNNQSVTLDDNEKTTDDVSPATNKSVACIHI